ncbi:AMP-binding protein [Chitinophaga flava]|nr:AMP-binding protein [Chitinophaga flava]
MDTIVDHLLFHAQKSPHKTAFIILEDSQELEKRISYQELKTKVEALAVYLYDKQLPGKRVLLVYQGVSDFIISFLACQYAGVIPVPVSYIRGGRQFGRLMNVMNDARVSAILCTHETVVYLEKELHNFLHVNEIIVISTDNITGVYKGKESKRPSGNGIALIQYTSGSTDQPKGVVITHENLISNQLLIRNVFGCTSHSVILSWLPFHHDMGLIGNLLHTIYIGCTCVLMPPFSFMQTPGKWLKAISGYKVTHSGGPNFAYDLCVEKVPEEELGQLDLSSWKTAYNGSEPVHYDTIQRFSDYYKRCGFNISAFYPCYGLAEATLLVAGVKKASVPDVVHIRKEPAADGTISIAEPYSIGSQAVVSCGAVAEGVSLKIISAGNQKECGELEEGEICIAGTGVTSGYWNRSNDDVFYEHGDQLFLRTGDLGFVYKGELFVHGRLKEMLNVRGQNIYPYDIERMVASLDTAIEENGVAVFCNDASDEEVVLVAEIRRTAIKDLDTARIIMQIDQSVTGLSGILLSDVVLVKPLGILRTTSGKLQRLRCRDNYQQRQLSVIASKRSLSSGKLQIERDPRLLKEVLHERSPITVYAYLTDLIRTYHVLATPAEIQEGLSLTALGIDSLRATELVNIINNELHINIDVSRVFQDNTLLSLSHTIGQLLWLKNEHISGEEIII